MTINRWELFSWNFFCGPRNPRLVCFRSKATCAPLIVNYHLIIIIIILYYAAWGSLVMDSAWKQAGLWFNYWTITSAPAFALRRLIANQLFNLLSGDDNRNLGQVCPLPAEQESEPTFLLWLPRSPQPKVTFIHFISYHKLMILTKNMLISSPKNDSITNWPYKDIGSLYI